MRHALYKRIGAWRLPGGKGGCARRELVVLSRWETQSRVCCMASESINIFEFETTGYQGRGRSNKYSTGKEIAILLRRNGHFCVQGSGGCLSHRLLL